MKIFVTGGAGFIGSSLIDKLLAKGYKVITIDNFNDYYDPKIKERNISDIKDNMKKLNINKANFHLYRDDIRDTKAITSIFNTHKIDIIIHLAAMAGVRYSIANPKLYYDVNLNGTLNILEVARKNNIKKFLLGSSSSVYGNNTKIPFSEKDVVDYPISPYAASKKAGELLCHTYHHLYDMSIVCLRFFTVYGPRQRPDLAIHKFVKLIMENKPIPFFGDGTTERDYTYIDDIIDGILRAINWLQQNKEQYEILNIGNSKTTSLIEMVKTIEEILQKKAKLVKMPMQLGDVNRTFADITKATRMLGYSPNKELKDGIRNFVRWLNKQ